MKTPKLRTLAALGIAGLIAACSSGDDGDDSSTDTGALTQRDATFGPSLFRDDFHTYLSSQGHYSDDQIRQLVYMPTDGMMSPRLSVDASKPFDGIDRAFKNIKPSDIYQNGIRTPFGAGSASDLEAELSAHPVHIVVVPGIFGEFIPVSPFEEVFQAGGSAKRDFEARGASVHDKAWSSAALKDIDRTLGDTLRVASIDNAQGKPMLTVTYLKPELGSLESFGTLDENADYYLPRLKAYFDAMGTPDHLYVMGYSRGMATALNLVSRADKEHATWMPKLKGVIGLAGVIYGSQLADAAMGPGTQHDMLTTMQEFVENKLESCVDGQDSFLQHTRNAGHWTAFAARMGVLAPQMGNHNTELRREGIDTAFADVGSFASFTRRALFGDPKKVFDVGGDDSVAAGVLNLSAPGTEYCQNIERFKKTATQIIKGVETLTSQSRIDWFHTHTLPAGIKYFAVTGTMGDATPEGAQPNVLVKTPVANDPRSVDFRSLRGNYYDLLGSSGTQLQDSQVAVPRGRFWGEVNQALNPNQAPMKTYFMGTVGIHHWGLSFPRAFATHDGLESNPFPRSIFLKSIATFVSQVERRDQ